ncbi:hypothetical protein [Salinibacterium sp. SWN1162]|uniref:hypothetical protein n=1 Tax=Salinibacterium sp. SWN1162 TaxID=2792053 RepID=UPI0018CE5DE6|nr:hypothetical protein [Salinibacterium sp. SWN1162]MBH0008883.1 hypothetical protein [Salinibacterium sp. SWN1162]
MSVDDENQFIVPPPGMVPPVELAKPAAAETHEAADLIDLPPGIVDSGAYRMAVTKAARPSHLDAAPAFFPAGAHITPIADDSTALPASVELVDAAPPTEPTRVVNAPDTPDDSVADDAVPFDAIEEATTIAQQPRSAPPLVSFGAPWGFCCG